MHKRVIFLDIDGVLNTVSYLSKAGRADAIDPSRVELLNDLVARTEATVVLSSAWRVYYGLEGVQIKYLIPAGFKGRIMCVTPDLQASLNLPFKISRGIEIACWLHLNPTERFVILDDSDDVAPFKDYLVQTSFYAYKDGGLQPKHIRAAEEILLI
jgi:hypothetical protein